VGGRSLVLWSALDQRIIDNAVAQWRQSLRASGQAEGGHFEHLSKNTAEKLLQKNIKNNFMQNVGVLFYKT